LRDNKFIGICISGEEDFKVVDGKVYENVIISEKFHLGEVVQFVDSTVLEGIYHKKIPKKMEDYERYDKSEMIENGGAFSSEGSWETKPKKIKKKMKAEKKNAN
jgi:hypothetical protein